MSFRVMGINGHPSRSDIKDYICQTVEDISKLPREGLFGTLDNDTLNNEPCGIGSTATVVEPFGVYVLGPDNAWVEI